jgi:hypothetical protein
MQNVNATELNSAKNKAVAYLEKSVYTLAMLLGLDLNSLTSATEKPNTIIGESETLAFESLIKQVAILEGLRG